MRYGGARYILIHHSSRVGESLITFPLAVRKIIGFWALSQKIRLQDTHLSPRISCH